MASGEVRRPSPSASVAVSHFLRARFLRLATGLWQGCAVVSRAPEGEAAAPARESSPAGLRSLRSLTAPLRGAVSLRGKGSVGLCRRQRGAGVWAPGDRGSTGLLGGFSAERAGAGLARNVSPIAGDPLTGAGRNADSFMADGPRLLVVLGSSWPSSGAPTPMSCGCHSEIRERPRRQAGALSFAPLRTALATPTLRSLPDHFHSRNVSVSVRATWVFSSGDSTSE